jgi:23S rRNA (uracil1939-C5)-methyltransferase
MIRGEELELRVENFGSEGKSVARVDNFVVFVRGGIPGDTVRARLVRVSRKFAEAEITAVVIPSPLRVTPRCRFFGVCGGCTWQHLSYQGQLDFKRQQVADALERIGGFSGIPVLPTIGAEDVFFYRNKMEFSFGTRWLTREEVEDTRRSGMENESPDRFALGLHIPQRFDRVLDIDECYLQSPASTVIVNTVRAFCRERNLSIYSTTTHTGFLRNLVIREGKQTGELMVNLVTSEEHDPTLRALCSTLAREVPAITTIVNNITTRKSQVAVGEREIIYTGSGFITERIGRRTYRISANSFFQTNTVQAERLYDTVRRMAALRPGDVVFDLYSGTGTIALHVADDAAAVLGIEAVASAVEDARKNAAENRVNNCAFVLGDLKDRLVGDATVLRDGTAPDVILVDPPRAGMHPKVVEKILGMHPRRIVYVSCNPATQARDAKLLCEGGVYGADEAQPVDMFPHTTHVENVLRLSAAGSM